MPFEIVLKASGPTLDADICGRTAQPLQAALEVNSIADILFELSMPPKKRLWCILPLGPTAREVGV